MLKKARAEDFEEAVVTRPVELRVATVARELVAKLDLFVAENEANSNAQPSATTTAAPNAATKR